MPILTIDRKQQTVTRIGNGAFARIYKNENNRVFALVDDTKSDYTKECMAYYVDQDNPHIPAIERENNDNFLSSLPHIAFDVYSMPLYKKLSGRARKTAKTMIKLWANYMDTNPLPYHPREWDYYGRCVDFTESLDGQLSDDIINALRDIISCMADYSQSVNWDFHMGNFMQDDNGTLILLDVIFDINATPGMS